VGGAVRYQSKNAVGNPNVYIGNTTQVVPDVTRPVYGPNQMNGDLCAAIAAHSGTGLGKSSST
jgi:hypothetical protein